MRNIRSAIKHYKVKLPGCFLFEQVKREGNNCTDHPELASVYMKSGKGPSEVNFRGMMNETQREDSMHTVTFNKDNTRKRHAIYYLGEVLGFTRQKTNGLTKVDVKMLKEKYSCIPRKGTKKGVKYQNGIKFEGTFVDGRLSGRGKIIRPDGGKIYSRKFSKGKAYGRGKKVWPDGSMYLGNMVASRASGKGNFTWFDGSKTTAEFR